MLSSSSTSSSVSKGFADPNNVVCESCEESQASEYCQECSMAFCGNCKKMHLKPKPNAHHQFISLDDAMKPGGGAGAGGGGGSVSRITRCEKHPHLEINTYCHTDRQAICAECVIDHHKGHEFDRLVNVVQGFKEEISQLADKVSFCLSFRLLFFSFSFDWTIESRSNNLTVIYLKLSR